MLAHIGTILQQCLHHLGRAPHTCPEQRCVAILKSHSDSILYYKEPFWGGGWVVLKVQIKLFIYLPLVINIQYRKSRKYCVIAIVEKMLYTLGME